MSKGHKKLETNISLMAIFIVIAVSLVLFGERAIAGKGVHYSKIVGSDFIPKNLHLLRLEEIRDLSVIELFDFRHDWFKGSLESESESFVIGLKKNRFVKPNCIKK